MGLDLGLDLDLGWPGDVVAYCRLFLYDILYRNGQKLTWPLFTSQDTRCRSYEEYDPTVEGDCGGLSWNDRMGDCDGGAEYQMLRGMHKRGLSSLFARDQ